MAGPSFLRRQIRPDEAIRRFDQAGGINRDGLNEIPGALRIMRPTCCRQGAAGLGVAAVMMRKT